MRAPVRIKAHGKAMRAKHLRQRTERRGRSFLLDQKRPNKSRRRIIPKSLHVSVGGADGDEALSAGPRYWGARGFCAGL